MNRTDIRNAADRAESTLNTKLGQLLELDDIDIGALRKVVDIIEGLPVVGNIEVSDEFDELVEEVVEGQREAYCEGFKAAIDAIDTLRSRFETIYPLAVIDTIYDRLTKFYDLKLQMWEVGGKEDSPPPFS